MKNLLDTSCACGIEVDSRGVAHTNHQEACEIDKLQKQQERLEFILAGVSTAILGWLKPEEEYSGKPLCQIEEALTLREAFKLACEYIHADMVPEFSATADKLFILPSLTDVMAAYLKEAREIVNKIPKSGDK